LGFGNQEKIQVQNPAVPLAEFLQQNNVFVLLVTPMLQRNYIFFIGERYVSGELNREFMESAFHGESGTY
jgi:hypothetical protein